MTTATVALTQPKLTVRGTILPLAILTLIALLVVPIPTRLLDVFFIVNILISILVLMLALGAKKPLDFSSFPTVLLFATLLRLALNVASTRVVLVSGHEGTHAAGAVIEAFGAFLIAGNYVVGLLVFAILVIINLVVITKGAGRISEVSARFTLDALPGKQMAIDADLSAGILSAEAAKARRQEVSTEADFYGAMDGASKFVKGDAIAALLILGINIIAGFSLGMISHSLSMGEAAERYVTLAVGDALVAQVPALLLSIAAAVIVTRVADKSDLAGHIGGQFSDPRSWLPVAIVLGALGMIPAMPQSIFLPAAAIAGWLTWTLRRRQMRAAIPAPVEPVRSAEAISIDDVSDHTLVTIELGYGLVHLVDEKRGAPLVARVTGVRKQLSLESGFIVPQFRVRDSLEIAPNDYRILFGGVALGGASLQPNRLLAIDTGDVGKHHGLRGDPARDPSFGCPALWIETNERDNATAEGFLTVDPGTVIATHLNHLLSQRSDMLLGPEEVRGLLDALKDTAPGLVDAIYPEPLSLAALTRLLRALLADGIALTHPLPLFSSLATGLQQTQEINQLIDHIRVDLGATMVAKICAPGAPLPVVTLDAQLESSILQGLRDPATGQPLIEPDLAQMIGGEVSRMMADRETHTGTTGALALIVQPPVRRAVARLLAQRAPDCLVLSISELPVSQPIEVIAVIGVEQVVPAIQAIAAPQKEFAPS